MRQVLHVVVSVLMWAVFGYYWSIVLKREIGASTVQAIQILALIVLGGLVLTLFWVRHNLRVARRNRRQGAPPPPPETLTTDTLGRPVVAHDLDALRRAPLIHVRLDEQGRKVYAPGPGEGLA